MAIEDPMECGRIIDRALATPGPVIVEAIVAPFTPSMPAKIAFDQAKKFAKSLARGEPNRFKDCLDRAFRQGERAHLIVK